MAIAVCVLESCSEYLTISLTYLVDEDVTDGVPSLSKLSYLNQQSNGQDTALHLACTSGYEESVEMLIAHNADVNSKAEGKIRPLHLAAVSGKIGIASVLLSHHAKINVKDEDQMTPLHK